LYSLGFSINNYLTETGLNLDALASAFANSDNEEIQALASKITATVAELQKGIFDSITTATNYIL